MSAIRSTVKLPSGLDLADWKVREKINRAMHALGQAAHHFWIGLADEELNTSYEAYKASMFQRVLGGPLGIDSIEIGISGFLPMSVEFGGPKFDMKGQLLKNRSPHKSKPYAFVPMHHAMEASKKDRRLHIPPIPIVKLMRGSKREGAPPVGTVLRNLPGDYHTTTKAKGYRSVAPRYEKLTKTNLGWHTFRTMFPPGGRQQNAWWHPGFKPRMLHKRLLEHIENVLAPNIFNDVLSTLSI